MVRPVSEIVPRAGERVPALLSCLENRNLTPNRLPRLEHRRTAVLLAPVNMVAAYLYVGPETCAIRESKTVPAHDNHSPTQLTESPDHNFGGNQPFSPAIYSGPQFGPDLRLAWHRHASRPGASTPIIPRRGLPPTFRQWRPLSLVFRKWFGWTLTNKRPPSPRSTP